MVAAAEITVRSQAIGIERRATTDSGGRYLIAALPVSDYQLQVQANGFTRQTIEGIRARRTIRRPEDHDLTSSPSDFGHGSHTEIPLLMDNAEQLGGKLRQLVWTT